MEYNDKLVIADLYKRINRLEQSLKRISDVDEDNETEGNNFNTYNCRGVVTSTTDYSPKDNPVDKCADFGISKPVVPEPKMEYPEQKVEVQLQSIADVTIKTGAEHFSHMSPYLLFCNTIRNLNRIWTTDVNLLIISIDGCLKKIRYITKDTVFFEDGDKIYKTGLKTVYVNRNGNEYQIIF
jgi:hypothetical protein